MMDWRVPLADLDYDELEEQAVLHVLNRRWLTMGSVTQAFETQFADFVGARRALAVSNATVALHLACLALGIGPGDEVIVPSLTFVATANAVLYTGADVRFADILGPQDLNLSPQSLESQINPRTRAIIVVHYGGYPCRMPEILEIAHRRGLKVIEDAAHAPGALLEGKHLGTWGDIGCFSFFSNKNLSTGEGGMLVTDRDDLADQVRLLRSHGMTSLTWDRHQGHAYSYDVVALGYNYRIDEIRSALGLAQLAKLEHNNQRRREITCRYWRLLSNSKISLPFINAIPGRYQDFEEKQYYPSHHLMPVLLPNGTNRQAVMEHMRNAGIQTSIHYPPIHCFHYYMQRYGNRDSAFLPQTEEISSRQITLPLYPGMSDEQVDYVASTVLAVLKKGLRRNRDETNGKPTFNE